MRDDERLDWERRIYEQRRTRNEQRMRRRRLYFWISVLALAVLVALLITTPAKSQGDLPQARKAAAVVQKDDGRLPGDDIPASSYADIDDMPIQYIGEFTVTHYCPCSKCCGNWADGITATGTTATEGRTIAVDPDVIPYGASVEIQYQSGITARYIAEDCGGAIRGNRIDVFMDSHDEALRAGILTGSVYVVEDDT